MRLRTRDRVSVNPGQKTPPPRTAAAPAAGVAWRSVSPRRAQRQSRLRIRPACSSCAARSSWAGSTERRGGVVDVAPGARAAPRETVLRARSDGHRRRRTGRAGAPARCRSRRSTSSRRRRARGPPVGDRPGRWRAGGTGPCARRRCARKIRARQTRNPACCPHPRRPHNSVRHVSFRAQGASYLRCRT